MLIQHQPSIARRALPTPASPKAAQARIEAAFRRRPKLPRWVALGILAVWLVAGAVHVLSPATYVSKWTLIVPVSNNSASVALDTIGQSSTVQGQTFGSVSMSPKVIYKEIADSEVVREEAARSLGMEVARFGRARVKLVDETPLMHFQIGGRTPEEAQRKAQALFATFQRQLDALRRDEAERRAASLKENLKQYQSNLDAARNRIVEFQQASGLRSLSQFTDALASAEMIRRRMAELRSELEKLASNQAVLVGRIGLEPLAAAAALKLASNAAFGRLTSVFAEANAAMHENSLLYGPNHPARAIARFKIDGAMSEIERIARVAGVDPRVDLRNLIQLINGSQQADLLRTIVGNESAIAGRSREIEALASELAHVEAEAGRMSGDATRLEALKKDHLVAEAVLTSAMARLDTGKSDLFSSYPIVQLLSEPDRPEAHTKKLIIALAAGLFGSLLILLAWGAAWAHRAFGRKRRKST